MLSSNYEKRLLEEIINEYKIQYSFNNKDIILRDKISLLELILANDEIYVEHERKLNNIYDTISNLIDELEEIMEDL